MNALLRDLNAVCDSIGAPTNEGGRNTRRNAAADEVEAGRNLLRQVVAKKRLARERETLQRDAQKQAVGPQTVEELEEKLRAIDSGNATAERKAEMRAKTMRHFAQNQRRAALRAYEGGDADGGTGEVNDIPPAVDETALDVFLAMKALLQDRVGVTEGNDVVSQTLKYLHRDTAPLPLDLCNLSVALDPYWWPAIFDACNLSYDDLHDKWNRSNSSKMADKYMKEVSRAMAQSMRLPATDSASIRDLIGDEATAALRRLAGWHEAMARHWLSASTGESVESFLTRWLSVIREAEYEAEAVFVAFAAECGGLDADDVRAGVRLVEERVPARMRQAVANAVKAKQLRGSRATRQTNVKDKVAKTKKPFTEAVTFDSVTHCLVKDKAGVEWVHVKRNNGKPGKRLGRKKA